MSFMTGSAAQRLSQACNFSHNLPDVSTRIWDSQGKPHALADRRTRFHGGDDMRGIGRIRQAGGAAAGADPGLVGQEQEGFGFHAVEGKIREIGQPEFRMAIPFRLRDGGEDALFQLVAEGAAWQA